MQRRGVAFERSAGRAGEPQTESELKEKQLLAQIRELTRQLDKEKHRKKEQARAKELEQARSRAARASLGSKNPYSNMG